MAVSTEDHLSISEHLARYCWAVDDGDGPGWAALWTEDGVFAGATPEPLVGREQLAMLPVDLFGSGQGRVRHLIGNLTCDYDGGRDRVKAKYYNLVTNWMDGGKFTCIALSRLALVRDGQGWLIERNDSETFPG